MLITLIMSTNGTEKRPALYTVIIHNAGVDVIPGTKSGDECRTIVGEKTY